MPRNPSDLLLCGSSGLAAKEFDPKTIVAVKPNILSKWPGNGRCKIKISSLVLLLFR